jgi:hypothetical protein
MQQVHDSCDDHGSGDTGLDDTDGIEEDWQVWLGKQELAATIAQRSTIRPISVDGPEFWLYEDLVNYTKDVLTVGRTSPVALVGSRDGTLRLWDRLTGRPRGRPMRSHSGGDRPSAERSAQTSMIYPAAAACRFPRPSHP